MNRFHRGQPSQNGDTHPTDDITAWCIAAITVPLNRSHMSLAPADQMAGMGGGRSHRRNPDYRRRTRQEAFNVFDLVNEGRASCRACHSVALSPPLIWSLVGLTAAQMKIKACLLFMLGLIRKLSRRRMNKGWKPFNDLIWKGSSVHLREFVNHRLGSARRTSERDPPRRGSRVWRCGQTEFSLQWSLKKQNQL